MTSLRDWMAAAGMTDAQLADRLGVCAHTVMRVRLGKQGAKFDFAEALLRLTGGAVTPNDLHDQRRAWLATRGLASRAASPPAPEAPAAPWMEAAE